MVANFDKGRQLRQCVLTMSMLLQVEKGEQYGAVHPVLFFRFTISAGFMNLLGKPSSFAILINVYLRLCSMPLHLPLGLHVYDCSTHLPLGSHPTRFRFHWKLRKICHKTDFTPKLLQKDCRIAKYTQHSKTYNTKAQT